MKRNLKVKESWQGRGNAESFRGNKPVYGKRKEVTFPVSLAGAMAEAAKDEGISQSRYIVEAVAEKLGFDLGE